MFRASPGDFVMMTVIALIDGLSQPLLLFTSKLLIDAVGAHGADGLLARHWLLTAWVGALLLPRVIAPVMQYAQANLAERFTTFTSLALMRKAHTIKGVAPLDDPHHHDTVHVLEQGLSSRPVNVASVVFFLMRDIIAVAGICAVLARLAWWLPVPYLLALVPAVYATLRFRERAWAATLGRSTQARELEYMARLALRPSHAIEAQVCGYLPWLSTRYANMAASVHASMCRVRRRSMLGNVPIEIGSGALLMGMLAWIVTPHGGATLSIGGFAAILQALALGHAALFGVMESVSILFERGLFFASYFAFLRTPDPLPEGSPGADGFARINLRNVSFHYREDAPALREVNLEVRRGERIAIVGANGSGKSTLLKLLLRLYDPSSGVIDVDGRDLRTCQAAGWRKRFAVVSQDVVRYAFTVGEAVRLSATERPDKGGEARAALARARLLARLARDGADPLALQLCHEMGGTELSGGQWQRLALARAFFRDAEFLILDEPTAALDPDEEDRFYEDFDALTTGKTALIVTHRLGAVRLADRIVVMRDGMVVEQGPHAELLRQGGEYARLWFAQAKRYVNPTPDHEDAPPP
jgi:ABC-type multidrug transport system fused ATPase/permease subunit